MSFTARIFSYYFFILSLLFFQDNTTLARRKKLDTLHIHVDTSDDDFLKELAGEPTTTATTKADETPVPPTSDDDLLLIPDLGSEPAKTLSEEEMAIAFDVPVLGTVKLYPTQEEGKLGFKAYFPRKGSRFVLGPLVMDQGELKMIDSKISYSGRAALFGKAATLALKDVKKVEQPTQTKEKKETFTQVRFGITPGARLKIPVLPGKSVELESVDLVVARKQPVEIVGNTSIFGQKVPISFIISKEATDLKIDLNNISLTNILTPFKNTVLDGFRLDTVTLLVKNFISKKGLHRKRTIELTGKADASSLPGIDDSEKKLKAIDFKAASDQTGIHFESMSDELKIPYLGIVKDAKIVGEFVGGQKKVDLQGTVNFSIPGVGSDFTSKIVAALHPKGIEVEGGLQQDVEYAGINIRHVKVKFSSENRTISLIGQADIKGYQADVKLSKDAKGDISAQASLKERAIKPFAVTQIPGIKDIELKDPLFKFEKKGQATDFVMGGTVTLFGIPMASNLHVARSPQGQPITLLEAQAPPNFKLSDGWSAFRGTLFDNIILEDLRIVLSSADFVDADRHITFKPGFNLISKTRLTGPFSPAATFTKTSEEARLDLFAHIAYTNPLESSEVRISIPNGVNVQSSSIEIGKCELEVASTGTPPTPSFSILTTLIVRPSGNDEPLNLTARIKFAPPNVFLSGTMQGMWRHPFGLPAIELSDIAAEIAFGPAFAASGLPASAGIAAAMALGQRHFAMAFKIPIAGGTDLVIAGSVDKLTLGDIGDVANRMVRAGTGTNSPIPLDKLPDSINVEKVKVYIVPKTTTIGELSFDKGLTVQGKINLPGFEAYGGLNVSTSGIIAEAYCSEINWGPLKISKSEHEKKPRPKDEPNGPLMRLAATLEKQELKFSGLFKIGDILKADAYFLMASSGIDLYILAGLGEGMYHGRPLLEAKIEGKSSGSLSSPNFTLIIDFENNTQAFVKEQVHEGINIAKDQVNSAMNTAIHEVEKLEGVRRDAQRQITDAQNKIRDAQDQVRTVNRAIDEEKEKLRSAQDKVRSLQNQVDDMSRRIDDVNTEIRDRDSWYNNLSNANKALRAIDYSAQQTVAGLKLVGLEIAKAVLIAAKATANAALEVSEKMATVTLEASKEIANAVLVASSGFLETAGRKLSEATLAVSEYSAKGVLMGVKGITTTMLTAFDELVKRALSTLDIRRLHYEGSLQGLASGNLANVGATIDVLGQSLSFSFDLNVKDAANSMKNLAEKVAKKVISIIRATLHI